MALRRLGSVASRVARGGGSGSRSCTLVPPPLPQQQQQPLSSATSALASSLSASMSTSSSTLVTPGAPLVAPSRWQATVVGRQSPQQSQRASQWQQYQQSRGLHYASLPERVKIVEVGPRDGLQVLTIKLALALCVIMWRR